MSHPVTFGKLEGHVTDAITTLPIPNAEVTIDSALAVPVAVYTDSSGYYGYWFDESGSPFEVAVSATGYEPETATGIMVIAGGTTTQDFELQHDTNFVVPELPFGTITALFAMALGFTGFYAIAKHRKRI